MANGPAPQGSKLEKSLKDLRAIEENLAPFEQPGGDPRDRARATIDLTLARAMIAILEAMGAGCKDEKAKDEGASLSIDDVASALNIPPETARQALRFLESGGWIREVVTGARKTFFTRTSKRIRFDDCKDAAPANA